MNRDRGFTLAEVLVTLAIFAVLAALIVPQVTGQLRRGQSTALANQLTNLRTAITNYRDNVSRYPRALMQLTTAPVVGDVDLCGTALSPANRNAWRGPYLTQPVLVTGMPVADFTVRNNIIRNPATNAGTPVGQLRLTVQSVPIEIAADLEKQFDGDSVYTTGNILYAGDSLTFVMLVRDC
jgi:prepilin-type N-terminal cleavage/methylation domain-containing protein